MKPTEQNILGIDHDVWNYESCTAHVMDCGKYFILTRIVSKEPGKGHGSHVLSEIVKYYGDVRCVPLNDRMQYLCDKYGIKEITE